MSNQQPTIVKYKNLEILCKRETVQKYLKNELKLTNILISDEIYKDSSRGDRASETELTNVFDTTNTMECIKIMLEKGEYKLTTNELREKTDQKRKQLVHLIHTSYLDPKTKCSYSRSVIESVIKDAKIRIDPFSNIEKLLQENKQKIIAIIPLKPIESINGVIIIPYQYAEGLKKYVYSTVEVGREKYISDGWKAEVTLNQNVFDSFNNYLNSRTNNEYTFTDKDTTSGSGGYKSGKNKKHK
jgi:ribosome maturation protein SDO1